MSSIVLGRATSVARRLNAAASSVNIFQVSSNNSRCGGISERGFWKDRSHRYFSARVQPDTHTNTQTHTHYGGSFSSSKSSSSNTASVFPSIVIGADGRIEPQGSYAEAQAEYLDPDPEAVERLVEGLAAARMGVVAHYYMDVEVQGVLHAVQRLDPGRVAIADSLLMGEHAVTMASSGKIDKVACLGVDFMSESVQAILRKNGLGNVPVYRATSRAIGCSLAESAERRSYRAWLESANSSSSSSRKKHMRKNPSLHVVYINTSLKTKAESTAVMPTITCTSSNVLRTILQATAQVENLDIYYGPDTYMGRNLETMIRSVLDATTTTTTGTTVPAWTDERIRAELHPLHTRESLRRLVGTKEHENEASLLASDSDEVGLRVFPEGNCVVHHMFGAEVVDIVKENYEDAFVTAHLEVPGEMFSVALEARAKGRGVVGSTSDILKFITKKVEEASQSFDNNNNDFNDKPLRLRFILGTEAGMVTSIVRSVKEILGRASVSSRKIEAEIVFPVASEAVTRVDDGNDIVPGVAGGEGCSTAGGCATCPFMKMNDLDALSDLVDMVRKCDDHPEDVRARSTLDKHLPPRQTYGGGNGTGGGDLFSSSEEMIEAGVEPILHMREFMKTGKIGDDLVRKILATSTAANQS